MAGVDLELKQLQKMVMTTELKQALDLLTMPLLELQQFVREQMETNPVLDEDESAVDREKDLFDDFKELSLKDRPAYGISYEEPYSFEARTETYNNLYEYLLFQLKLLPLSRRQRGIGIDILSYIDDNGYLLSLPEDIAIDLQIPITEVAEVMAMIRRFDPVGVCCINLADCLLLQLDKDDEDYEKLQEIIGVHLDMVASNRVPQIAKKMKLSVAKVNHLVEKIRALDPRPGLSWGGQEKIDYITPDVTVRKIEGEWVVILNEWGVPKIAVSDYYQNLLAGGGNLDAEAEAYLKEKFHAALWVLRSIEQRRRTITDVVMAMIRRQAAFFDEAAEYPAPLKLRDLADDIDVHESTVSRALSGKYIQTPRGLFSFKYFFPKSVSASDQNVLAIKKLMREIIAEEDPLHPLRDGEITELLKNKNVHISRRTVAKYREQLGYPIAGQRKSFESK